MDPNMYYWEKSGINISEAGTSADRNYVGISCAPPILNPNNVAAPCESELPDDCEFRAIMLKYINDMLMEEDVEACSFEQSAALQAAERSLYEVVGEKYPDSQDQAVVPNPDHNIEILDENYILDFNTCDVNNDIVDEFLFPNWDFDCCELEASKSPCSSASSHAAVPENSLVRISNDVVDEHLVPNWNFGENEDAVCVSVGVTSESTSQSFCSSSCSTSAATDAPQSSCSSSSSTGAATDVTGNSPLSTLRIPKIFSDDESISLFKKGFEEASKFLPNSNGLFGDMWHSGFPRKSQTLEAKGPTFEVENYRQDKSRGRKHSHHDDEDLQGGNSNKQSAVYSEPPTLSSEMFDMVLLSSDGKSEAALRESLQRSNIGKSRGKKQQGKKNVADLSTLLTLCAHAVAANDLRTANEFLQQIREHSSPTGDGMQRLAHYFADGLEARIAGSGTGIYKAMFSLPPSAAVALKAYHLYLSTCPFRTITNFLSNKTIINVSEKATRLHVVDFGGLWGFQWPSLIQHLSFRTGGPPRLRITGIDLPRPGFRPSSRIEETGRRLSSYAESFNVPFEFNPIAKKWDTIKMEELKIEEGEVLVVNCIHRLRHLHDETLMLPSPRSIVLDLIRSTKPDVFIHGILNATHSTPFFIPRFREALFHFTSLFDMLETIIPREIHERMLIEKAFFGRQALNVIACEDAERIERPETYKQWRVRNVRAGFKQIPFDEELVKIAKNRVKSSYHKDFLIDEDGHWVLQGWKGRTLYALSAWRPAD